MCYLTLCCVLCCVALCCLVLWFLVLCCVVVCYPVLSDIALSCLILSCSSGLVSPNLDLSVGGDGCEARWLSYNVTLIFSGKISVYLLSLRL
jgi:hypothetical protein